MMNPIDLDGFHKGWEARIKACRDLVKTMRAAIGMTLCVIYYRQPFENYIHRFLKDRHPATFEPLDEE